MKKFSNFNVLIVANDSYLLNKQNFKSGLYPELYKIFDSLFGTTKICFCNEEKLFDINDIQNKKFSSKKLNLIKIFFEYFLRFIELIFGRNFYIENLRYRNLFKNFDYKFDIIIAISSTTNSGVLASLISKKFKKPYIILEHMTYYQRGIIRFWHKKLLKEVQSSATLVAPVSEPLELTLKKFNQKIKTSVVYNPIGSNMFEPPNSDLISHVKEFAKGSFCFGAWTVWRDIKRLDLLLDSFAKLKLQSNTKCKLIIGGRSVSENLIAKMKEDKDILFLGRLNREQIHSLSAFVDCCVIPSDHETFGLPIAEAMSQGTPVISTKSGGVEDLIDQSMGIVVNRDDGLSLKNAMALVINNYDFSSQKIKQFAKDNFSYEVIKQRWSNLLHDILLGNKNKNPKIALCFYGLVGSSNFKHGKGQPLDPNICANYYRKNFFDYHSNVDVFIHSQSFNFKEELKKIYKPNSSIIEKQKSFLLNALIHPQVLFSLFLSIIRLDLKLEKFKYILKNTENAFSRWYSTKKVIDLKNAYEKENKFEYDLIFLTRLDLALLTPFILNEDMKNKLTVSNRNDLPTPKNNYKVKIKKNNFTYEKGIADYWFVSDSKIINNFSKLYERKYFYNVNPHLSSLQHSKFLKLDLNFRTYRGIDHNMYRRILKSDE